MRILLAFALVLMGAVTMAHKIVQTEPERDDIVRPGTDGRLWRGDSVYKFSGTNFWYGPILASEGRGGDRPRLHRELDSMQAAGISNLRILAGAEGPEGLPHHISPVLLRAPGEYNDTLLAGLDYLMAELERRQMTAVIYLTNAWEWSGGYGSLLQWTGHGVSPVPGIDGYRQYVDHVSEFVLCDSARRIAVDHARYMASRVNTVTHQPYRSSPALMAWQVANEPRAFSEEGKEALLGWIREMAVAIKSVDSCHMVSTGSEGFVGCELDIDLWTRIHSLAEIDYAVIHLWPTNWGWARRTEADDDIDSAIAYSQQYISEHLAAIAPTGKALVVEEFGYPRSGFRFDAEASVASRDEYYASIMGRCMKEGAIAGFNFWGWGGEPRPSGRMWQPGDPYMCDPAHEPQGMYSVLSTDRSTIEVIRRAAGN